MLFRSGVHVQQLGLARGRDVNAWPSFALYRDEAAERIAAHLALRFLDGR